MRADEIPVAYTPPGGYGTEMPPPILGGCTEPLVAGAPDMRGMWRVVSVEWSSGAPPSPDPIADHVERVEQCGDPVVVTSTGIVHDMRADGTYEHGVHDVAAVGGQEITGACSFENGVHLLPAKGQAR